MIDVLELMDRGIMPGMPGTGFFNSLPGRFGRDMLGRGEYF